MFTLNSVINKKDVTEVLNIHQKKYPIYELYSMKQY
jgi:hypothetical protein